MSFLIFSILLLILLARKRQGKKSFIEDFDFHGYKPWAVGARDACSRGAGSLTDLMGWWGWVSPSLGALSPLTCRPPVAWLLKHIHHILNVHCVQILNPGWVQVKHVLFLFYLDLQTQSEEDEMHSEVSMFAFLSQGALAWFIVGESKGTLGLEGWTR